MTTECIIQAIAACVAVTTFVITYVTSRGKDRRAANRETYQRLELASVDLFRFEAENIGAIRPVWEKSVPVPVKGTAEYIVTMDYVCQILNLFEMAIRLRKDGVVPPEVFGSWVVWFHNVANAPHFEEIWNDVLWDYTPDLRAVINKAVSLKHNCLNAETRLTTFFSHVADVFDCDHIRQWPERIRKEQEQPRPRSRGDATRTATPAIEWTNDSMQSDALAGFLVDNMESSYISHGELQDGRAIDLTRWSPDLRTILRDDLQSSGPGTDASNVQKRVAVAHNSGTTIAVMLVETIRTVRVRYAILHDLLVDRNYRGKGIGSRCMEWLEQSLREEGIPRLFLESGAANEEAHRFFASREFTRSSVVMFKELAPPTPATSSGSDCSVSPSTGSTEPKVAVNRQTRL